VTSRAFCNKAGNMPSTPGLLNGAKGSIAQYAVLQVTILVPNLQSGRLAGRADAGAADSCVIS